MISRECSLHDASPKKGINHTSDEVGGFGFKAVFLDEEHLSKGDEGENGHVICQTNDAQEPKSWWEGEYIAGSDNFASFGFGFVQQSFRSFVHTTQDLRYVKEQNEA